MTTKSKTVKKNVFFRVTPTVHKLIKKHEQNYKSRGEFFTALLKKEFTTKTTNA